MHEYSLVSSLLHEVERQARSHHATGVRRVHVRIGALAGVDPELFRTAFEMICPHTLCAGAELSLTPEPAGWECPVCRRRLEPGAILQCPECHVPARLEAGGELVLERLEMEVSDV